MATWNNLPYRGFNGTITNKITNDENSVPSNRAVSIVKGNSVRYGLHDITKNLYNPETRTECKLILNGALVDNSNWDVSDYIEVEQGIYSKTGSGRVSAYSSDKQFIKDLGLINAISFEDTLVFNVDNIDIKYIRVSIPHIYAEECIVVKGKIPSLNPICEDALDESLKHNIKKSLGNSSISIPYTMEGNEQPMRKNIHYFDSNRDVTDFIYVADFTRVRIMSKIKEKKILAGATFYKIDSEGNVIDSINKGNYTTTTEVFEIDVPEAYNYMVVVLRNPNIDKNDGVIIEGVNDNIEEELMICNSEIPLEYTTMLNTVPKDEIHNIFTPSDSRDLIIFKCSGMKSIKIVPHNDIEIPHAIYFMKESQSGISDIIGSWDDVHNSTFEVNVPNEYNYAIYVTRRENYSINGQFSIFGIPKLSIPILKNTAIASNGNDSVSLNYDCSSWINCKYFSEIELYTLDNSPYYQVVYFIYDSNALIRSSGNKSNINPKTNIKIPVGAKAFKIFTKHPSVSGDVADKLVITLRKKKSIIIGSGGFIYSSADDAFLNSKFDYKKNFFGKRACVFGSSNTTQYYGIWFPDLCNELSMDYRIYGVGGSTYPDLNIPVGTADYSGIASEILDKSNCVIEQVKYKLEHDADYIPDVIMINSGMNETSHVLTIMPTGNVDAVMEHTVDEIINTTNDTYGKNTLCGAIRWVLETLMFHYPDATIIGMLPWQSNIYNSNIFFKHIKPYIEAMYARMGVPLIDCFSRGGIYSQFENEFPYRYTLDNIHVKLGNKVNFKGRQLQKQFVIKEFLKTYYDKY